MKPTRDLAPADVAAVVCDFAGIVLGLEPDEVAALNEDSRLDSDEFGADSLKLLEFATAVATFFRLFESELEDELLRHRRVGDWTNTVLRGWACGSRRITFMTSGTTGLSARCTHHWATIADELDFHAQLFSDRRRVLGLVGPRHIYGFLFCTLLPRWLGVPFVDLRGVGATRLANVARTGDLVVGFPTRWNLAANSCPWAAGVVGVTSTGPVAAETVTALTDAGLARMVEIYGSSETGGIGWRDDQTSPLRLIPYWSLQENGRLQRAPSAAGGKPVSIEPPDILLPRLDGFDIAGRRDGTVQVAGVNVSCARVARVLTEHPDVVECAVRLMPHDQGGRLKAFIVPIESRSAATLSRALRTWLPVHLTPPEIPANLTFGPALPRDSHGKLCEWLVRNKRFDPTQS